MKQVSRNIFSCLSLSAIFLLMIGGSCTPDPPQDTDAGLYHTYSEIDTELHDLARDYSDFAQVSSIGKSHEGRDLWAMKISDNVLQNEDEPVVFLMGGHHAREWISIDVPFLITKYLLNNYATDSLAKRLVDHAEIWVVPMVNPDGHHYSVTTDRFWRKNRRDNNDGTFGVDLNRNYGHEWGGPGSSGDTFSDTYHGITAFSEPETQAIHDLIKERSPKALISYHSFTQLILYPWGSSTDPTPHKNLFNDLAGSMSNRIRSVHNLNYIPQQSSALYVASGDATDWLYALFTVPAFTVELRPRSSNPGFRLPEDQIQPAFEENLPAALYLIDWAIQQSNMAL